MSLLYIFLKLFCEDSAPIEIKTSALFNPLLSVSLSGPAGMHRLFPKPFLALTVRIDRSL